MANSGTGGRSEGKLHYRHHACSEKILTEILPHIRDTCPETVLLGNTANYKTRSSLANLFSNKKK